MRRTPSLEVDTYHIYFDNIGSSHSSLPVWLTGWSLVQSGSCNNSSQFLQKFGRPGKNNLCSSLYFLSDSSSHSLPWRTIGCGCGSLDSPHSHTPYHASWMCLYILQGNSSYQNGLEECTPFLISAKADKRHIYRYQLFRLLFQSILQIRWDAMHIECFTTSNSDRPRSQFPNICIY